MTDRTGLRSISVIRPITGQPSRQARRSVVLARPAQRRNDRFRASISAHSGLGAHVRRHARLGAPSYQLDPTGPYRPYAGLPLILRRFLRRRRLHAIERGPTWPESQPQIRRSSSSGFSDVLSPDEPTAGDERTAQLGHSPWVETSFQDLFSDDVRDAESWATKAPAPAPIASVLRRHAGFLGRDVLPLHANPDAPAFPAGATRAGPALPLAVSYRLAHSGGDGSFAQLHRAIASSPFASDAGRAPVIDRPAGGHETVESLLSESASTDPSVAASAIGAERSSISQMPRPVQPRGLATSHVIPSWSAHARFESPVPSLARQVFALHAPRELPPLAPSLSWRDVPDRDGGFASVPSWHEGNQTHGATATGVAGAFRRSLGSPLPLRRLFAMANAAIAAQAAVETLPPPHGALGQFDSFGRLTAGRAMDVSPRPLARLHRTAPTGATPAFGPAVTVRNFATHSPYPLTSWNDPETLPPAPEQVGAPGLSRVAQASSGDQSISNRVHRAFVTQSLGGDLTDTQSAAMFQRADIFRSRILRQPVTPPLIERLAAHDEPFAPTMRRMHATALAHVLRRLPPTAGAQSLAVVVAQQQQTVWPQKPTAPSRSPESAQANVLLSSGRSPSPASAFPSLTGVGFALGSAGAFIPGAILPSSLARWFAQIEPEPAAASSSDRPTRSRIAAPLLARIHRTDGGFGQATDQPAAVRATFATAPGEPPREPVVPHQLTALSAGLRRSPAAIARALADLLGDVPSAPAFPATGQALSRRPPFNATFAPVFPLSTLPTPVPRQTPWQASTPTADRVGVDMALARRSIDPQREETDLPPFVARQIGRAVNDLRVTSNMPLPMTLLRAITIDGASAVSPQPSRPAGLPVSSPLVARALRRSRDDGEVMRALQTAPSRAEPSSPVDTGSLGAFFSQSRQSVLPDMTAAAFAGAEPGRPAAFEDGWPGFPLPSRRRAMLRRDPDSARSTQASSPAIDQYLGSSRRTPFERSPVHHIFRRTALGPSSAPATGSGNGDGTMTGAGVHRGQGVLGGPAASDSSRVEAWSPVLSRILRQPASPVHGGPGPLVFRSALPAAGEPTVLQRAQAAEAMAGSSGQPLPPMIRRSMERLFRMDLAPVRVHSGPTAARATDLVAARAMASGANVFLPGGVSDSPHGDDLPLLAHELTHVAHHFGRRAPSALPATPLTLAHRTASTEQDAEQVERMVAGTIRRQPAATSAPADLTLARKPAPVTIMRVDETSPAPGVAPSGPATTTAASPTQEAGQSMEQTKQDQQKLADQIFYMLEQRLIVARERGGHRF